MHTTVVIGVGCGVGVIIYLFLGFAKREWMSRKINVFLGTNKCSMNKSSNFLNKLSFFGIH